MYYTMYIFSIHFRMQYFLRIYIPVIKMFFFVFVIVKDQRKILRYHLIISFSQYLNISIYF